MDNDELERLSALVDDELAPEEVERLLDALIGDPRARERLSEYRRIGEALRGAYRPAPVTMRTGLSERLEHLVAEEDARSGLGRDRTAVIPLRPRGRAASRGRAPAMGRIAVAAAVVAAAGLGFLIAKQLPVPGPEQPVVGAERLAVAGPPTVQTVSEETPTVNHGGDVQDPSVQQRLRGYLVNHSEYAGGSLRSLHPYVRVVAYEEGR